MTIPALDACCRWRLCCAHGFVAAIISIAFGGSLPCAAAEPSEVPETAIRAVLKKWTADFNAGNAGEVCNLFSPELRYDFRGQPERNYNDICSLLHRSLEDRTKKYTYSVQFKEILVWGEVAVVRLGWTLRISSVNSPGSLAESVEPGIDIFGRQADGSWKIIRYLAYEE
jgi:ketosteroid isomerase-like protein